MQKASVDIKMLPQSSLGRTSSHSKFFKIPQCLFSRITFVSCFVAVTFLVCLTQEFTYILNYHSYVTTDTLENLKHSFSGNFTKSANKIPTMTSVPRSTGSSIFYSDQSEYSFDDWRKVTNDIYVYSAYWDGRLSNKSLVRIIAGVKIPNVNLRNLKCLMSFNSSIKSHEEITATHDFFLDDHNKSSRAAFIMCSMQGDIPPSLVALVSGQWNESWHEQPRWLKVHRLNNSNIQFDVGVCVRPMFNYSDTFRIVEFVAFYEALGVERFIFYKYDALPEVNEVIEYLQSNNYSIDWYPWNLPSDIGDMWALGQVANMNDCIYRHMGIGSYIAVVDFDEFITPRHSMTIPELLIAQDLPWKNSGSFVMRSCVFCLEYEMDSLPESIPKFITQTHIRRENKVWPFHHRSKYIVKPNLIISIGIHYVKEHMPEVSECLVKPSQVLVHHYRAELCGNKGRDLPNGEIDSVSRNSKVLVSSLEALQTQSVFLSNQIKRSDKTSPGAGGSSVSTFKSQSFPASGNDGERSSRGKSAASLKARSRDYSPTGNIGD
ncbi:hypothetical protein JTE90_011948 [Oedothorax gibbosus]|uniref:Glycosyltransferase family 92 protein n=1 Tax=Oedothorax gibbosus TaxID=931172 RepID=A0AAV6V0G8_9ARAC|nr:hypothetical protein JTE90_011948 [Oedothorax gibbosus]